LEAVLEAGKAPELPPVLENDLDNDNKQDIINITKASLCPGCQYFTAEEVEAGDPLIIDSEEVITTDSNTGLEDGDDNSDESFNTDRDDDDIEDHIIE
jgi:hypothetical protein